MARTGAPLRFFIWRLGERYWWYLCAANGMCLAEGSRSYRSEKLCRAAIKKVRTNMALATVEVERYE